MAGGCPDLRAGDTEYDAKGMPFRTLGSTGLRVPLFSLGTCMCVFKHGLQRRLTSLFCQGSILSDSLDDGVTVKVTGTNEETHRACSQTLSLQNLVKTAFDNGINMFDTAEGDRAGDAEVAL